MVILNQQSEESLSADGLKEMRDLYQGADIINSI